MEPRWTPHARDDLFAIYRFISRDDPDRARTWVARIRARARSAAEMPRAGRIVPEFGRADIREVILRTYRIVYRVSSRGIEVLTVVEGHRLLPDEVPPAG